MPLGYAGSMLRINLTDGSYAAETPSYDVLSEWVGGTGLGVKYLYDEVDPSVAWHAPDNRIILASGPLGGTPVKGSGNYGVVTKGPLTGGFATSQAGGYFGAFLRFCGYDGVIIQGKSREWVYICISDDTVEIRSASHLIGLDTVETQDALCAEIGLKPTQLSVCCIGPAGENLVRFACVVSDYGHVAAHNGIGAVLGSKMVKAIAVIRGRRKIELFDREKLHEVAAKMNDAAKNSIPGRDCYNWGTNSGYPALHRTGGLPVKNLTTSIFPENVIYSGKAIRERFAYKKRPCWGCNWNHCGTLKIDDGEFAGFEGDEPEFEGMAAMGSLTGFTNPAQSVVLANKVDRLGLDVNETGWLIAWVMECYEKGYLADQQLDGLAMTWGNFASTMELLERIATRKGVGSLLAEGVRRAAKEVGSPALDCAVFTEKGNTPRSHDHRALWIEYLDTCTSSTGTIEATGGAMDVTQHGLVPCDIYSWEQVARQNAAISGRRVFEDSLGICRISAAEDIRLTVTALTNATGDDYTVERAMKIGKRIVNLMRVYNLRSGITAELDKPSTRYSSHIVDGPAQGRSGGVIFQQMKELYYEMMGWDRHTGTPLPETLEKLNLSRVL